MKDRGYWIEPDVVSSAECDRVLAALTGAKRSRAGVRHMMSNPVIAAFAQDLRLISIAQKALGAGAIPFRATLFEKTGDKNWLIAWHQDTALPLVSKFEAAGWGPWSEKAGMLYAHAPASVLSRIVALRVHLDESKPDNGPLRVIPGSHVKGVLTDAEVAEFATNHLPVECPAPRGGVIAMRPLLIHASSKALSDAPRRVLHVEYADSLDIAPGIRLAIA
jgi:ectoine hydroxylase-related dioxygenase (phytanoyl-CoA dioxygenase family)